MGLNIRYIEKFAAWNDKDLYQKAQKHARNIANIIISNISDVDKIRLDARYSTVNGSTKRIKIFDYERKE